MLFSGAWDGFGKESLSEIKFPFNFMGKSSCPLMPWMYLEVELKDSIQSIEGNIIQVAFAERYLPQSGEQAEVFRSTLGGSMLSIGIIRIEEVEGDPIKAITQNSSKIMENDIVLVKASVPPQVIENLEAKIPKIPLRKLPSRVLPADVSKEYLESYRQMLSMRSEMAYLNFLSICGCNDRQHCKPKAAIELLTSAAQLNHPQAAFDLAKLYQFGTLGFFINMDPGNLVIKPDFKEAAQWLRKAAGLGSPWHSWIWGMPIQDAGNGSPWTSKKLQPGTEKR